MASGHMPPDASGRNFAALEPLYTRSDVAVPAFDRLVASVRSVLSYCHDSEQCHRRVQSLLVLSVRSLLLTPAVAEHLDRMCLVAIRTTSSDLYEDRFFVILRLAWFLSSCLDYA